jgi:hypothetical protein
MNSSDKKKKSNTGNKQATDEDIKQICICPHCNKKIRFRAKYAGRNANCPGCKQPIVLNPIQEHKYTEYNRTDRLSSIAGWTTSIVLHGLLLLSFAGVTWHTGIGKGGEERDVSIVVEDPGFPEYSDVELTSPEASSPELIEPSASDLTGEEPTEEIGGDSPTSGMDELTIVAPEVSDSSEPMGGDLGGLSSGGGGMDTPSGGWGDPGLGVSGGGAGVGTGRGGRGGFGTFFGSRVRGGSFVYVVDCSGSMSGLNPMGISRLDAVKFELIRSVSNLSARQKFFIIFYNNASIPMQADGLVSAEENNKMNYLNWARSINAGGGTQPKDAMLHALSLKPDAIWLLSDGEFDPIVCDEIRNNNPDAVVQIHTIAFHSQSGYAVLWRIANENGGSYRFIPP